MYDSYATIAGSSLFSAFVPEMDRCHVPHLHYSYSCTFIVVYIIRMIGLTKSYTFYNDLI
jgi:hypothetical protein